MTKHPLIVAAMFLPAFGSCRVDLPRNIPATDRAFGVVGHPKQPPSTPRTPLAKTGGHWVSADSTAGNEFLANGTGDAWTLWGPTTRQADSSAGTPTPDDPCLVGAGTPCSVDYVIDNVELTQAVQCIDQNGISTGDHTWCTAASDNEVPLVTGKDLLVRVFVRIAGYAEISRNGPGHSPKVTVTLEHGGGTIIAAPSVWALRDKPVARDWLAASANVLVNGSYLTNGGSLTVTAHVDPAAATYNDPSPANNTKAVTTSLLKRRPIRVEARAVGLKGTPGAPPDISDLELLGQEQFLASSIPAPEVDYQITAPFLPPSPDDCTYVRVNADSECVGVPLGEDLMRRRFLCDSSGSVFGGQCGLPDQVVGWLPRGATHDPLTDRTYGGQSFPRWFAGLPGIAVTVDAAYLGSLGTGSMVLAHEVFHNLGRRHPTDDEYWPYIAGNGYAPTTDCSSIRDVTAQETGIQVFPLSGEPSWVSTIAPATLDIMMGAGRCGDRSGATTPGNGWLAPFTYGNLFCAQSEVVGEAVRAWKGNVSPLTGCEVNIAPQIDPGNALIVSGRVSPSGSGLFDRIFRIPTKSPWPLVPSDNNGAYCLRQKQNGTAPVTLDEVCFNVSFVQGESGLPTDGIFSVVRPLAPGANLLTLDAGTQILASRDMTGSSPSVDSVTLADGHLSWTASDVDNDPLTFTVYYSPDGALPDPSRRLVSIAYEIKDTVLTIPFDALPGSTTGFFRVIATDRHGFMARGDSGPVTVDAKAPTVGIASPLAGASFARGAGIVFRASVHDLQDPAGTHSAFAWSSSIDGPLGGGNPLLLGSLTPGTHSITLTVTDPLGLSASATTVVTVVDCASLPLQPDRIVAGADRLGGQLAAAALGASSLGPPATFPTLPADPTLLSVGSQAQCVADFDRDGRLDVLLGSAQARRLSFFRRIGIGQAAFDTATPVLIDPLTPTGDVQPAACGDFDGDGSIDIATSYAGDLGALYVYLNRNGAWLRNRQAVGLANLSALAGKAVADFNRDGWQDIAVFTARAMDTGDANVHVFLNNHDVMAPFSAGSKVAVGSTTNLMTTGSPRWGALAVGDFDRDGLSDLWAIGNSKQPYFFKGLGAATFASPVLIASDLSGQALAQPVLAADDTNGDGYRDFIIATGGTDRNVRVLI